jgi:hypothetical protein
VIHLSFIGKRVTFAPLKLRRKTRTYDVCEIRPTLLKIPVPKPEYSVTCLRKLQIKNLSHVATSMFGSVHSSFGHLWVNMSLLIWHPTSYSGIQGRNVSFLSVIRLFIYSEIGMWRVNIHFLWRLCDFVYNAIQFDNQQMQFNVAIPVNNWNYRMFYYFMFKENL